MRGLLYGVFMVVISYTMHIPSSLAEEDLSARIAHLEKSLSSIEHEEEVVDEADAPTRNARTNALLAEVRQNIALTIADLRDDRPNSNDRKSAATVKRRLILHTNNGTGQRLNKEKEIELKVVVESDDRKAEQPARKRRAGHAPGEWHPKPHPRPGESHPRPLNQVALPPPGAHPIRSLGDGEAGRPRLPQRSPAQHLLAAARHLDAAGYESMAKKARSEAERLTRDGRPADVGHHPLPRNAPPHVQRVGRAIGALRRDVDQLRKEMNTLKRHAKAIHFRESTEELKTIEKSAAAKKHPEVEKQRRAVDKKKEERAREAKKTGRAANLREKEAKEKRRAIEQQKIKREIEKKRRLERKRRERELKKKREAEGKDNR